MNTWIALFRGINVGGKHILPMKSLAAVMETLGFTGIRTYIQSGNMVFLATGLGAAAVSGKIEHALAEHFGFKPRVLLLTRRELELAVSANPFPQAVAEPKTLHLAFLTEAPPNPDISALKAVARNGEKFVLDGKVLYLHTPAGLGQSKLAGCYEKLLGVPATARNWNTVVKVLEMATSQRS